MVIEKKSQDDRWTGRPDGQKDQGHGLVLHDQREEYQQPITPRSGSSKVLQGEVPRQGSLS